MREWVREFILPQKSIRFRKSVRIVGEKAVATACAADGCSTAGRSWSVQGWNRSSGSWWPSCHLKGEEEVYLKVCQLAPQTSSSASAALKEELNHYPEKCLIFGEAITGSFHLQSTTYKVTWRCHHAGRETCCTPRLRSLPWNNGIVLVWLLRPNGSWFIVLTIVVTQLTF